MNGIVKSFNLNRGYGFIQPLIGKPDSTPNVFVHISACRGGVPPIGCEVSFTLVRGDRGPQAFDVKPLKLGGEALKKVT